MLHTCTVPGTCEPECFAATAEFLHVKPGKGAAFVRTKLKNLLSNGNQEKTFRGGETVNLAEVNRREVQFSYVDGDQVRHRQLRCTAGGGEFGACGAGKCSGSPVARSKRGVCHWITGLHKQQRRPHGSGVHGAHSCWKQSCSCCG
jgi:hypothetical protein